MDIGFASTFTRQWQSYFRGAELPICYYYTNVPRAEDQSASIVENRCLIGNLNRVRAGFSFVYDASLPGCTGGKRYTGFSPKLRPKFEYFLSCGIEGEMEGERYKQSPDIVNEWLAAYPPFQAPAKYLVFKRWDRLAPGEEPVVAIFFTTADVLSGLFTLANFDRAAEPGVIAPMGAGCASIVAQSLREAEADAPHCILGMFDVSARPQVPPGLLTLAAPIKRLQQMASFMDESFLITSSWRRVQQRIASEA